MSQGKIRYHLLDGLRGICVISMVVYHLMWDLVRLFGHSIPWFSHPAVQGWQELTSWVFLLISGFAWHLGRNHGRQGAKILLCGLGISLVTRTAMPEAVIYFGVLTLLGSATLLMIPLDRVFSRVKPWVGLVASLGLFALTYPVEHGALLTGHSLPESLYRGGLLTGLGFPAPGFFSSDYFPLLPWFFLFAGGYFAYSIALPRAKTALARPIPLCSALGRHALVVYLLHQPALYALLVIAHI